MNEPHRVTPLQWAQIESSRPHTAFFAGLLELRDRLAAAEQRISELEGSRPAVADHAPAGSLVEDVRRAIGDNAPCSYSNARAAILAVAQWFELEMGRWIHAKTVAAMLREEVERHG